jgi:hypothetical protein
MCNLGPRFGSSSGRWLAASRVLHSAFAVLLLVVLPAAVGSAGCESRKATLSDLSGFEELKARFNRDAGKPRIVLLLSPT